MVYKNISDFGITQLNTLETYIPYSSVFQTNLNESITPVVTATPINSMITVSIISQDAHGFTVRKSENTPIQINWIAMAKVKDHLFETNTNYSEEERAQMLDKVKAGNNSIRKKIDYENGKLYVMGFSATGIVSLYRFNLQEAILSTTQTASLNKITFSPNPTTSNITFTQEINSLEVFDLTGKKIKSFENTNTTFDVSGLEKGMYLLKGKTVNGDEFNEKLIKN